MGDPTDPDAAVRTLRRELYWAQAGLERTRADTVSIRDQLRGFALRRRTEEFQLRPAGDRSLESPSSAKHVVKVGLWRLLRFATVRYDRLLADLAELNASLAERLLAAEDEIARARAELDELRRDRR
jgi:hypothetical protein